MIPIELKKSFEDIVGAHNYDDSKAGRLVYSYDATPQFQSLPDAVIAPNNTEEVAAIVKLCNEYKIPIVPRGSGTNLCAGTCPTEGGIVLLFKHLNQVLEIDEENLTATVEPGVITLDFIHQVEERGLFYPPHPSSMKISTIGGNINENSGGFAVLNMALRATMC